MRRSAAVQFVLSTLVTLAVIYFLYDAIWSKIDENLVRVSLSALPYHLTYFSGLIVWLLFYSNIWMWLLIVVTNENQRRYERHRLGFAFFSSLLARYIPGKVAMPLVRSELSRASKVTRGESLLVFAIEQLHMIFATCLCLFPLALLVGSSIAEISVTAFYALLAFAAILCGIWIRSPGLFIFPFGVLLRRVGKPPHFLFSYVTKASKSGDWRRGFYFFNILVVAQGLLLIPLVLAITDGPDEISDWVIILAAYPVARLIGQLGLLFPAGVGLREGAYVVLTSAVWDAEVALAIGVLARAISLAAETTLFLIAGASLLVKYPQGDK